MLQKLKTLLMKRKKQKLNYNVWGMQRSVFTYIIKAKNLTLFMWIRGLKETRNVR